MADFCLPLGGLLHAADRSQSVSPCRIAVNEATQATQATRGIEAEVSSARNMCSDKGLRGTSMKYDSANFDNLHHNNHSHHSRKPFSSDCFVFVLDDKTVKRKDKKSPLSPVEDNDEKADSGVPSPGRRLYGICVRQTRKLTVPLVPLIPLGGDKSPVSPRVPPLHSVAGRTRSTVQGSTVQGGVASRDEVSSTVYWSRVCFAIVTRFPLFDFFFDVIREIIQIDDETNRQAKRGVEGILSEGYIPARLLEKVLSRLIKLPPPTYGEKQSYSLFRLQ